MRVKGKGKLIWKEQFGFYILELQVKFKLPNQIFNRKETEKLEVVKRSNANSYFWNRCFKIVLDKKYLENYTKNMIIDYIKNKYKETEDEIKIKRLNDLIKQINEDFEVEVEYKVNKK